MQQIIVLSDFNGTISLRNLAEDILRSFADDSWKYYDNLFLEGKLSLEKTVIAQYSLIKASKDDILRDITPKAQLRENFRDLLQYCFIENIQIKIITTGLDFVIEHLVKQFRSSKSIDIIAIRSSFKNYNSIEVKVPVRHDLTIKDFKLDHVNYYKNQGYKVIFIGDSYSDFQAVEGADFSFAVRGSKLANYCEEKRLSFSVFDNFSEVISTLKKFK